MTNRSVDSARRGSAAVYLIIALAAAASVHWSRLELQRIERNLPTLKEAAPLYLPGVEKVRLITLGFDNFAANLLWFSTLNYFGKQLASEQDFRWLGHMCTLVTDLNPHSPPIVEFCATMLPWVAKQDEVSTAILKKAIKSNPHYWRYRYLLGFNYWYFHEDYQKAADTLSDAAELPGAPPFVASLAARLLARKSDPNMAVAFLENMLKRTNDENARKALSDRLQRAKVAADLQKLESIAEQYRKRTGKWPQRINELVDAGLLRGIPLDPYREPYLLDPETGTFRSEKGKYGLHFPGKTAQTGLARRTSASEVEDE